MRSAAPSPICAKRRRQVPQRDGRNVSATDQGWLSDPSRGLFASVRRLVLAAEVPAHARRTAPDGQDRQLAVARSGNQDLPIMPGLLPLDDLTVRNELVKYLPSGWDPIVDRDIDGPRPSRSASTTTTQRWVACRRVAARPARSFGQRSSVSEQKVRGIGIERVRLGLRCAGPIRRQIRRCATTAHRPAALPVHGQRAVLVRSAHEPAARMEDRMQRYDERATFIRIKERLEKMVKAPCSPASTSSPTARMFPTRSPATFAWSFCPRARPPSQRMVPARPRKRRSDPDPPRRPAARIPEPLAVPGS